MNWGPIFAMLPLGTLAIASAAIAVCIAVFRNHRLTAHLTIGSLLVAALSLVAAWQAAPSSPSTIFLIDRQALYFMGLVILAAIGVAVLSLEYFEKEALAVGPREDYYLLLVLATAGAATLICSTHFISLFLGFEILSVSLYAMIAYRLARPTAVEAGVKYLILAGVSSAFLLMGMAFLYADLGTLELSLIAMSFVAGKSWSLASMAGLGLIAVGIGFKLSLTPFHLWAPDIYEGAPAPVGAFVATVSKGAVVALLLRLFSNLNMATFEPLFIVFAVLAVASMFAGNLLALRQQNVKRLLAFSSIAHMGYILVALLASGPLAPVAVAYYLAAYFVTMLGAFGVISVISHGETEADRIEDYEGLAWSRPWEAAVFTVSLLSLAGIPLTAGFIGKFYLLAAGVKSSLWILVVILVINSAISLFYYLRVVAAIFRTASPGEPARAAATGPALCLSCRSVLFCITFLLVWLGIYPAPAIRLIEAVISR